MWALAVVAACAAFMFWTYLVISSQQHEREEARRLRKDLDDAEAALRTALEEKPEDFDLHNGLRIRIKWLRKHLED